ncbi:hypothetical protein NQ314_014893 [Rhamnusium bicolor]|uniref:SAM domain-containing protein n=1 Tax=Rhamnusium bicolor TaxID=1586634 RepID=A0AAV8X0Q1_9CUCU|nr:hypothetical protein NQ314_014893 [Rhamnusium bicolor]
MAHQDMSKMFLLIHTMTITESDYVVQAQFFHTFPEDITQINNARLVGRRLRLRIHPSLRVNRNKANLQRLNVPNLKTLMKRNSPNIKHHLRTMHISSQIQKNPLVPRIENGVGSVANAIVSQNAVSSLIPEKKERSVTNVFNTNTHLTQHSSTEETARWLTVNRFEKYIQTFERFSGDDMLRMSRDDLIQICGDADGIRLHNAIHLKTIAPKLKIYVCRENSSVYNAIFLSAHSNVELLQKLSSMMGVSKDQVRDIYMEGPHSIHVQLNNDLLQHIKEETMFSLEVMQENNNYIFLLKRAVK